MTDGFPPIKALESKRIVGALASQWVPTFAALEALPFHPGEGSYASVVGWC